MNYSTAIASGKYAEETDVEYRIESALQKKKVKKPGFIKRWFAKMSREAWEDEKRQKQERESAISVDRLTKSMTIGSNPSNIDQPDRALHFTVYNANGGRVIETRRYNTKTDRSATGLYVITSDKDFGREIDKIITMEALK
jgi:hypothetical protein